jgi:putative ABC transport system permease protein
MALVRDIFNANLTGDGEPERVAGALIAASLFRTLRARPVLGRAFLGEEEQVGASDVVILSDGLWRRRFGGDRTIVGRKVLINGTANTVVGVMSSSAGGSASAKTCPGRK